MRYAGMITQLRRLPYFLLFDIIKEEKHFGGLLCNRGTDECHVRAILNKKILMQMKIYVYMFQFIFYLR